MAKTVVITGASTGIGRACALKLDQLGWRVFAGVRRETDGEALRQDASERLTPIQLEVTDAAQIDAARKTVEAEVGEAGLDGLVNNAGIAVAAPLEFVPIEDLRKQLEVNVISVVAVTQAFMPLIRTAGGRIVNMGSIGGSLAVPFAGPYSASKFALEAVSDALRMELAPWGIHVSLIKPAAIKTPIWERGAAAADDMLTRMPAAVRELYGKAMLKVRELAQHEAKIGAEPEAVARCVVDALKSSKPKTRYTVGPQAGLRVAAGRLLPDRMRDRMIFKQTGLPNKPDVR